ncbi:MAG TPA: glycosyltransferase family A protein, partial [Geobacteraceae bacterium]
MERISVIIPVKPGIVPTALAALRAVDYPDDLYEVFVAEGRRPSGQRNRAAAAASGDILYFLDDDSLVTTDCMARLDRHFASP